MKHSELKNIIKEIVEAEIGKTTIDPETGVKSTLTGITPETGKMSWDVSYDIDPKFIYDKLDQMIKYMDKAETGTELGKILDVLKNLKNKTHRLIK